MLVNLSKSHQRQLARSRRHRLSQSVDGTARRGVVVALVLCASVLATLARGDGEARHVIRLAVPPVVAKAHWDHERGLFAAKLARAYALPERAADEFAGWILEAGARHGLAPELIASLVAVESSFRKHARSVVGAAGPAQVRKELWHGFCGGFLDDPEQNIYCGAQILAHYLSTCARHAASAKAAEACALRSYNVGYGNRDNEYFLPAGARYLAKIDRQRGRLDRAS